MKGDRQLVDPRWILQHIPNLTSVSQALEFFYQYAKHFNKDHIVALLSKLREPEMGDGDIPVRLHRLLHLLALGVEQTFPMLTPDELASCLAGFSAHQHLPSSLLATTARAMSDTDMVQGLSGIGLCTALQAVGQLKALAAAPAVADAHEPASGLARQDKRPTSAAKAPNPGGNRHVTDVALVGAQGSQLAQADRAQLGSLALAHHMDAMWLVLVNALRREALGRVPADLASGCLFQLAWHRAGNTRPAQRMAARLAAAASDLQASELADSAWAVAALGMHHPVLLRGIGQRLSQLVAMRPMGISWGQASVVVDAFARLRWLDRKLMDELADAMWNMPWPYAVGRPLTWLRSFGQLRYIHPELVMRLARQAVGRLRQCPPLEAAREALSLLGVLAELGYGTLTKRSPDLLAMALQPLSGRLDSLAPGDLAALLRCCAVLGHVDRALLREARDVLKRISLGQWTRTDLARLLEAQQLLVGVTAAAAAPDKQRESMRARRVTADVLREEVEAATALVPPAVLAAARVTVAALPGARPAATVHSAVVMQKLRAMGCAVVEPLWVPEASLAAHGMLAGPGDSLVALRCGSQDCYSASVPHREVGHSLVQRATLCAAGLRVVDFPFFEWEGLETEADRRLYLCNKLLQVGVVVCIK